MDNKLPSVKILGVSITNAPRSQILDFIIRGLKENKKKIYIVTPNPEMLVYASSSSSYRDVLNSAQVSLADGIGITIAGNILKKRIKERITGVDLMIDLVGKCAKEGLSIGLLGGSRGVAEKTSKCLMEKHPNLRVVYVSDEWEFDFRGPHIDILFVAFGVPKQEEWIAKNLEKIPATAAMGVGGSFDFISGNVKRAPKLVRDIGMEWVFRLAIQPWRIKRQMALPVFVAKVLREKISN